WAADVYQGAPTPVTAYLSVASKGAGLVLMFHLFYRILGRSLGDLTTLLAVLAATTMTVGNLAAVTQKNIKRLMAFSAVSQAGYLIMGFIGRGGENVPAMIFYMVIYVVTNLAVFSAIIIHSNETGSELVTDYRGLSRSNPLLALAMMIALFGLAGIPPLAGFVGKFFLFNIASKAGLHWLVAVAAVNATVSLYYYLRIVRQMYIEPAAEGSGKLKVTPVLGVTLTATTLASVVLGIVPFFYEVIHAGTSKWIESLLSS
ncbi:MAG: NADH-quinone oxidoreductase subunit N, partial [Deltaproteobacteria bacterium]|nr:NADH-quinone oxidoreductase subunit N [Deltaproteobacteria bacterium]